MSLFKKEKGSLVVEAALILPLFLSMILLLITFVKISIVEITLTNNVSAVTEVIATHIYPVGLMYYNFSETETGQKVENTLTTINDTKDIIIDTKDLINEYSYILPEEIKSLINLETVFENGLTKAYDNSLNTVFQPIVDSYIDKKLIHLENLHVTRVVLPNLIDGSQPYIGIEICYEMPLNIPFFSQKIAIKKEAYERIWMGDEITASRVLVEKDNIQEDGKNDEYDENSKENIEDEDDKQTIKIDYISSPIQRGKKVKIIVEGPKNKTVKVKFKYPSGFEKEKTYKFNNLGILVCNNIIGGHANEGSNKINGELYEVSVISEGMHDESTFEVLSKEHMDKYLKGRLEDIIK